MVENEGAPSIVERLAGKRLLITGVTGFLGQVVFERLLLDFPETRLVLLVRPQVGQGGRERVEGLLKRPTFDELREREGEDGLPRLLDERVEIVEGDFAEAPPALPGDVDVVFPCAAAVAFDPPIHY